MVMKTGDIANRECDNTHGSGMPEAARRVSVDP